MRKYIGYIAIGCSAWINAQTALYNIGNLEVHTGGQVGLHTNLINDGILDDNLGLVGFYGDTQLTVSGAFAPTFFDLEIANPNNVVLQTGINTFNTTNFITGNFETPRTFTDSYLNYLFDAAPTNSSNVSKVDGYAAITNKQNFIFPVGDAVQLSPLVLTSAELNQLAKCAYFFESANSPSTFPSFNTASKGEGVDLVSATEFWRLEGNIPSTVQLSWNERSAIPLLTDDPLALIVVGWSKATNQWESLAGAPSVGDITQGFVSSSSFVPDEYEILTLASTLGAPQELISIDNYLVTANGDGNNDSLVIPELEQSPNNSLQIFDRFGLKVFEMENYTDEFRGFANTGTIVMGKEKGLPTGVYFFVVEMRDLKLDFQGFLYLTR